MTHLTANYNPVLEKSSGLESGHSFIRGLKWEEKAGHRPQDSIEIFGGEVP